ncbi:MAG: hypothetical protein ABI658_21120 [Acidimicrobiales bacterium]
MVVVLVLLAAPVVAVALSWGSWGWAAAAGAVAVLEYATLRHSQRFSARVWRSAPIGRRQSNERAIESLYVVAALAGVALFARAVLVAV